MSKVKKEYSIAVNLTEEDLWDLQDGTDFNWSYPTIEDENIIINIHLFAEDDYPED